MPSTDPQEYGLVSYGVEVPEVYLATVQRAVADAGAEPVELENVSGPGWEACRLRIRYAGSLDSLRLCVRAAASALTEATGVAAPGAQTAVVPPALLAPGRKLLVMDVDSTLIRQEVIELLAAHAGREAEVAAVTEAAMRGELDFAQSLHARVGTLAGLPETVIAEVGKRIELTEGAEELVGAFLDAGHAVAVVSGGFNQVLAPLAQRLRLTRARANQLGIEAGALTGTVVGDVVDRAAKAASLRAWAAELDIDEAQTIAVGDGANDLDMLAAAGLGVAFNAKPAVAAAADAVLDLPSLAVVRHFANLG